MEKITISGIAENSKAGAIVLTKDKEVYYLEGISAWSKEIVRKEIEVIGDLVIEFHQEEMLINEKGEYKQGISGEIKKIIKPKWKLIIRLTENDSILEKLKRSLPKNWTLKIEKDRLLITCNDKAYSIFENKINAPLNTETQKQKEQRFIKNGKLIHGQFVFIIQDKLTEQEITDIKLENTRINQAIEALRQMLKNIPLSPKDGNYWPRNEEEQKRVSDYENEKNILESKIINLPDYQSEKCALYLESETGIETEFVSIFPEKYSEEVYKMKSEVFGKILEVCD